ncbi:transposase [Myxococcus xanthus]|uniref:transposase n=1 Tax=Myxococcus xanthus TaxID=34 RepID=UPI0020A34BEA|nr:transposase [Myxococcus xanthus]
MTRLANRGGDAINQPVHRSINKGARQHYAQQVVDNCGQVPEAVTADTGYFSEENVAKAASMGINAYIATGRLKHGEEPEPVRGRMPRDLGLKEWMARRLRTKKGRQVYARRKVAAEPPLGQSKQARGFRQLLLRGLTKARGEWALICLTHNLSKLHGILLAA